MKKITYKTIYRPKWNSVLKKWVVIIGEFFNGKLNKTPYFFVSEKLANEFILNISKEEK